MTVGSDQRGEGGPSGTDAVPSTSSGGEPPLREVLDQIRRTRPRASGARPGGADHVGPRARGVGAPPPFDHRTEAGGAGPGSLLPGGFSAPPGISQDELKTQPAPAESGRTSTETSVPTAWSGAAEVSEPLFATEVPQPALYATRPDEEARSRPSIVELTPREYDAVLAAEFGQAPTSAPEAPTSTDTARLAAPPAPTAPAALSAPTWDAVVAASSPPLAPSAPTVDAPVAPGGAATNGHRPDALSGVASKVGFRRARATATLSADEVLDILLGAPADRVGAAPDAPSQAMRASSSATLAPSEPSWAAPPPPPAPVIDQAPPPPPPPPPLPAPPPPVATAPDATFVDHASPFATRDAPPVAPAVQPVVPDVPSFVAAAPDAAPASTRFVIDESRAPDLTAPPVDLIGAGAPDLTAVPDVAPAPEPTVDSVAPVDAFEPSPVPEAAAMESLFTAAPDVDDEMDELDERGPVTSAASLATEILSAAPDVRLAAPAEEASESEIISKDLTLIARGRRKRFRLR